MPEKTKQRNGSYSSVVGTALVLCVMAALAACRPVIIQPGPRVYQEPREPEPPTPPTAPAPRTSQSESFTFSDRLVGVYYFYWYKWPTAHFFDDADRRDDALTDHFPEPTTVDYESVNWHLNQFTDMAACGIDFALPVYWGAPGLYDRSTGIFSTRGLDAMQAARDLMLSRGMRCPRLGMFYDTTTLLNGMRGDSPPNGKADLTTPHGRDVFYATIRDYFQRLDRRHWAMLDGRPIVGLYSAGFTANYDQAAFDYVYRSFERDFGCRPYIIADASWRNTRPDAFYGWGAALSGPKLLDVAQIGPGYNDTAVPGRNTPVRDRENGRFYENSWIEAIRSDRHIVLLETWNEMHEGTDLCRSAEYGTRYLDLTRKYAQLFRSGARIGSPIVLQHPQPIPRGPNTYGQEFANERQVWVNFANNDNHGVRIIGQPDGRFEAVNVSGRRCVRSLPGVPSYLYFTVPDPFYFNLREPVDIEIDYLDDAGGGELVLEYDSYDPKATLDGAYKKTVPLRRRGTMRWITYTFRLNEPRFANRQNGGADFRIAILGEPLCVSRVTVTKGVPRRRD